MNKILLILILITNLFSCKNQMDMNEISTIEYRFSDSSTPPQYHRSFTITVDSNQAHLTVDVYGTILADSIYTINNEKFNELKLLALSLESAKTKTSDGATGTKHYRIELLNKNKESIYLIYWDSLNKVQENTYQFIEQIKALIPDLREQLDKEILDGGKD